MKKIPWNKGRKLNEQHKKNLAVAKKIVNEKKNLEMKKRKCYNDKFHKPYIRKSTNRPSWFKHPTIFDAFLCGLCYSRLNAKPPKYSSKEERYKAQSKMMKINNPMYDKKNKIKLSKSKIGKKIGPVHSEEFKKKLSEKWKGSGNPNADGLSDERKAHLSKIKKEGFASGKYTPSLQKKGKDSPLYGVPRPASVRSAISQAQKGKALSKSTIDKIKIARKNQKNIGQSGTIPEFMVQTILNELQIHFKADVPGIDGRPDILIGRHIIFVDGVFSHACPRPFYDRNQLKPGFLPDQKIIGKKTAKMIWDYDEKISQKLISQGYFVLRLWEDEIRYQPEIVISKIQYFLKN